MLSPEGQPPGPSLRIAILGSGPIGIEAALYGRALGHQVSIYEQGELAQALRSWGHVRMFSPWSYNTSALGRARLSLRGIAPPAAAEVPSGEELRTRYLLPLSQDPLLAGCFQLHSRVVEVGRSGLLKGDQIGQASRANSPFRLLIERRTGEHIEAADVVVDCTGTYGCPNAIGDGGIPAPGERWLGARLWRHLPDVGGADRARFAGRRVLVVGGGLSAATAALALARLCEEAPQTELCWALRAGAAQPYPEIADDRLPQRAALVREANRLAQRAALSAPQRPRNLRFLPGVVVDALQAEGHQLRVALRATDDLAAALPELFDEVIGLCGYGPDNTIYRELQVHECYASRGPMRQAAALLGEASADCLVQPAPSADLLRNPEPRFFILGAKSYGRHSGFLLQTGHAQVRALYSLLAGDATLDLYATAEAPADRALRQSA